MMKRVISFMLALVMVLCILPTAEVQVSAKAGDFVGKKDWTWPVPASNRISSCYLNYAFHENGHYAIDISAEHGAEIVASYTGTVIWVQNTCTNDYGKGGHCPCGQCNDIGKAVFILHDYLGTSFVSRYAHMASVSVSMGDVVAKGTPIGTVGCTGYSTGNHLDFKVYEASGVTWDESKCIDPLMDRFLRLPAGLNSVGASCCDSYVADVLELYSSYLSDCEFYSSYCEIETTTTTYMKSLPCSVQTNPESETIETYSSGKTLTATGIYHNGYNYWYQAVDPLTGNEGYIYSGDTKKVKMLWDVGIDAPSFPTSLTTGSYFPIGGTVTGGHSELLQVSGGIENTDYKCTVDVSGLYSLQGSAIDNALVFNALAPGQYTCYISAFCLNYFVCSNGTLDCEPFQGRIYTKSFTVSNAPSVTVSKPSKPSLRYPQNNDCYLEGSSVMFNWYATENTTHYNLYFDQYLNGTWERIKTQSYVSDGYTATFSPGSYRVCLQSTNSADWSYTDGDWICFDVIDDNQVLADRSWEYGNSSYMVFNVLSDVPAAQAFCESKGGYLATISSEEENNSVYNHVGYDSYLIGLTDLGSEGSFYWLNGESASYRNWASGEPNDDYLGEDYVEISGTDKLWNDTYRRRGFVCEIDGCGHSYTGDVCMVCNPATVRYHANGGSGAPEDQIITQSPMTIPLVIPQRFPYQFNFWATTPTELEGGGYYTVTPGDQYSISANTTEDYYAIWGEALVITPGYSQNTRSVGIHSPNSMAYFEYSPISTETYEFVSTTDGDTKCYLYDSEGNQLAYNDDGGENYNFRVVYELQGGETYYYGVRWYDSSETGRIPVRLRKRQLTVTYDANGGTNAPNSQMVFYNETITLSSQQPTWGEKEFLGWAESPIAFEPDYLPGEEITAFNEVYLYAVWDDNYRGGEIDGTNLTWMLDSEGTLTITGTGPMKNYQYCADAPWYELRDLIKAVVVEDGVTTIGACAFLSVYDNLKSVTISDSVTTVGEDAFFGCGRLTSVEFGDSVTTIENRAFYSCGSLTSVEIGGNVTTIGDAAFAACGDLRNIDVAPDNSNYCSQDGVLFTKDKETLIVYPAGKTQTAYSIPYGVMIIDANAFEHGENLLSVSIPESVMTIGDSAFESCGNLSSVTIPDSVTTIDLYAFALCDSLTSVSIGDGVTTIGDHVFAYNDSLTSVTIGNSVTTIGRGAFVLCNALTDVYYTGTQDQWDRITIEEGNEPILNATLHVNENLIASGYCGGEGDGTNLSWTLDKEGVLTITGTGAMADYPAEGSIWVEYADVITSVVIEEGVTTVGDYAFRYCSNIETADISSSVISLGERAFSGCAVLSTIDLEEGLQTIGGNAFNHCTKLADVTIPSTVTSIGGYAFNTCESLTSIVIPNGVTVIEEYVFHKCAGLTSVTIGPDVRTVEDAAFYACNSLTDVYFKGTEEEWTTVTIGKYNDPLRNATLHCAPAVEVVPFTIPGCAPNLESELEMGIAVPKAALPEDLEFTAIVKQVSGGEVVKTFEIPQSEWKSYNANLHMVYVKLAAKCMADDFSIEVTDQYGNVWNEPYAMSYRQYVINNIGKTNATQARKVLFMEMLNYGAAAQQRFNYNVDDLANVAEELEAYKDLSIGEVALTNKQVMGAYNLGSTVSLESRILVYSVFKGIDPETMYAEVSYTDVRDNEKSYRIEGEDFELYNAAAKAYKICVDTLVPADVDCAYTMTVYNADGTVYDTATEGLGSYLTRNIAKDPVFGATINFGMAAKLFFVGDAPAVTTTKQFAVVNADAVSADGKSADVVTFTNGAVTETVQADTAIFDGQENALACITMQNGKAVQMTSAQTAAGMISLSPGAVRIGVDAPSAVVNSKTQIILRVRELDGEGYTYCYFDGIKRIDTSYTASSFRYFLDSDCDLGGTGRCFAYIFADAYYANEANAAFALRSIGSAAMMLSSGKVISGDRYEAIVNGEEAIVVSNDMSSVAPADGAPFFAKLTIVQIGFTLDDIPVYVDLGYGLGSVDADLLSEAGVLYNAENGNSVAWSDILLDPDCSIWIAEPNKKGQYSATLMSVDEFDDYRQDFAWDAVNADIWLNDVADDFGRTDGMYDYLYIVVA